MSYSDNNNPHRICANGIKIDDLSSTLQACNGCRFFHVCCASPKFEAWKEGYLAAEKETGWKRAGSSDDNVDGKEVLIRYWVEFDRDPIKRRYKKQKATWHNYNKIWIGDVTTLPHRKVTHIMEIPEVEK